LSNQFERFVDMIVRPLLAAATTAALLGVAACGSGDAGGGASAAPTALTEIDYYEAAPQNTELPKILDACGSQAGVTVGHQQVPRDQFMPRLLQQASARKLPDLALIDNPDLQQFATSGALVALDDAGLPTEGLYPAIVDAGKYNGKSYGIAPGVNGLALYYNKDLFRLAGAQPPTTWPELTAAAKKLTQGKRYGIAFSAVGTEEGSFQFEPFFWTAGASLKQLDSPQAVQALSFVTDLVKSGSASKSVVNWTQADVNDQFLAGNAAMMVNGPWQLPVLTAKKDLQFGIVPIPGPTTADKPVTPLGGEVWTVGHSTPAREAKAVEVLKCLLSGEKSLQWSKAAGYLSSNTAAAEQQGKDDPNLAAFVAELSTARARTAELGTGYPKASQALYTALQASLAGGAAPQAALTKAQQDAS
jgi:multiple sugar transport system substrate-binding protein